MDIYVLDEDFYSVDIIDSYQSFIWTERYCKCGDFELHIIPSEKNIKTLREGYYLSIPDSEEMMIIEGNKIVQDVESGDMLVVTGRSLSSILERRILDFGVYLYTAEGHDFQDNIQDLLNWNLIFPESSSNLRKIDNFIFERSTDSRLGKVKLSTKVEHGENLYEAIEKICLENNVGFTVLPSDSKGFKFLLRIGKDRSYDQIENPPVVFSPEFDNIISTEHEKSVKAYRSVAMVYTESKREVEGGTVITTTRDEVDDGTGNNSGLNRREMFVDCKDMSNTDDSGEPIPNMSVRNAAKQRGREELAENKITEVFSSEIENNIQYVYGRDFGIGDIVQFINRYNIESRVEVTEVIRSYDSEGCRVVPSFVSIENIRKPTAIDVPMQFGVIPYSGDTSYPQWVGYDHETCKISGQISAIDIGTYNAVFTLRSGYIWSDGTKEPKTVTWGIVDNKVAKPTISPSSFVYDKTPKTPKIDGVLGDRMHVDGDVSAIDAGEHVVVIKLYPGFSWTDGSTGTLLLTWSIAKAPSIIAVNIYEAILKPDKKPAVVTYFTDGDGVVYARPSKSTVNATVTTIGNAISFEPTDSAYAVPTTADDEVLVEIGATGGKNYEDPSPIMVSAWVLGELVEVPTLSNTSFTYIPNKEQKVELVYAKPSKFIDQKTTVHGELSGINAGTYLIRLFRNFGFNFVDGSEVNKYTWNINPAVVEEYDIYPSRISATGRTYSSGSKTFEFNGNVNGVYTKIPVSRINYSDISSSRDLIFTGAREVYGSLRISWSAGGRPSTIGGIINVEFGDNNIAVYGYKNIDTTIRTN